MEHQLQDLIDRIKKDGFEAAELEARQKIQASEAESVRIVKEAQDEAARILAAAKKEADRLVNSGKDALRQAARDLSISVEKDLKSQLDNLLKEAIVSRYDPKVMEDAILVVAKSWANLSTGTAIVVNQAQADAISASLKGKLAELAKKGMEVKVSPRIKAGFRIQEADGAAYYDFSADTIAEALADFLSASMSGLIKSKE